MPSRPELCQPCQSKRRRTHTQHCCGSKDSGRLITLVKNLSAELISFFQRRLSIDVVSLSSEASCEQRLSLWNDDDAAGSDSDPPSFCPLPRLEQSVHIPWSGIDWLLHIKWDKNSLLEALFGWGLSLGFHTFAAAS